ncbi:hypothetical protein EI555_000859 [Monodon monoceros]|uniref:Cation/H+ exchanger transmembrane domain-containing protein n=1 Tax=Monodon monoceros TaxID=40151 RepID=A0A4V5P9I3_MONMO|nr:hypothetical protein EI555_000859 [Monodon monoceros]
MLSFTSDQVQKYADAIQWMDPHLFFDIFTPIILFNVAFDMDVYLLHKLFWQILLITIPGFLINYTLILWYLASVNKLVLKNTTWLLFSAILVSSDPMLTSSSIKDLGLSRGLVNLINGESLMTSIVSLIVFTSIMDINFGLQKKVNYSLGKLVGMSGIFTIVIMGLFLNSTSFKPGVEALLLEFWSCLSFVAFLMVFTFIGLLIPAHTYLYISFSDIYYSLNICLTLVVFRLLVFLLLSPLLSRLGHGFSWRWAFIMVWSEMKGTPNINMALLLAYSEYSLGSEREKSQVKKDVVFY